MGFRLVAGMEDETGAGDKRVGMVAELNRTMTFKDAPEIKVGQRRRRPVEIPVPVEKAGWRGKPYGGKRQVAVHASIIQMNAISVHSRHSGFRLVSVEIQETRQ